MIGVYFIGFIFGFGAALAVGYMAQKLRENQEEGGEQ